MASPHVSGAVLLLKEAFPELTAQELKLALYYTCTDLGDPGEDNVFGMGVINVLAAFNHLLELGHVPVSPHKSLDLLMVDMQAESFACNNEIHASLVVENAGLDTVYSFEVACEFDAINNVHPWAGVLAPGQRIKIVLPTFLAVAGESELTIRLQNPNGAADQRPLNDIFKRKVIVTDRERFPAHVEGNASAGICENTPALLRGEYDGTGSVQVKWFDQPVGGNLLGEGITFVTPPLAQADTFYAEATYFEHVGLAEKDSGDNQISDLKHVGLTFDVHENVTLKSVKVYTEATGLRQILLLDSAGVTLRQTIKNITLIGEARVELNWEIPPGKGYQIVLEGGKSLVINSSGAVFPYEIDAASITGTSDGQGANGVWYFFYDWEIQIAEPCSRTAVP
ncbi:MAG: S8 family serine peptidase, partial [Bacteroidota bacterium]